MKDYPINIFWSENDASYVADIPDLFPCTGFGDTPQRALAEVMVAREAWIETARENGLPFPAATSRSEAERGAG